MKFFKFLGALSLLLSACLVGCTTDSGDDDGETLVVNLVAGDTINGATCQVLKSGSSAYLNIQMFIEGSSMTMDNEYKFKSGENDLYSIWLYTDIEFKNFPKTDAMSICKSLMDGAEEDESVCGVNGGSIKRLVTNYGNPLSDDIIENLVEECDDMVKDYMQELSLFLEDGADDDPPEESTHSSGDVTPNYQDPDIPASSSSEDYFCKVSQENGKVYQRSKVKLLGTTTMSSELMYEKSNDGVWRLSAQNVFEGADAKAETAIFCADFKEKYFSEIQSGQVSVVCGELNVELTQPIVVNSSSTDEIVMLAQDNCNLMLQNYNIYDSDGPQDSSSELPTSCKITQGDSSITLSLSYSTWDYTSTIQISGSTSHEEELFTGDYGDKAEKMCLVDKNDYDELSVSCEGGKIISDGIWDLSMSIAEMKILSDYMCSALLDGTITFDELMFED